jgi:hypothetical protein
MSFEEWYDTHYGDEDEKKAAAEAAATAETDPSRLDYVPHDTGIVGEGFQSIRQAPGWLIGKGQRQAARAAAAHPIPPPSLTQGYLPEIRFPGVTLTPDELADEQRRSAALMRPVGRAIKSVWDFIGEEDAKDRQKWMETLTPEELDTYRQHLKQSDEFNEAVSGFLPDVFSKGGQAIGGAARQAYDWFTQPAPQPPLTGPGAGRPVTAGISDSNPMPGSLPSPPMDNTPTAGQKFGNALLNYGKDMIPRNISWADLNQQVDLSNTPFPTEQDPRQNLTMNLPAPLPMGFDPMNAPSVKEFVASEPGSQDQWNKGVALGVDALAAGKMLFPKSIIGGVTRSYRESHPWYSGELPPPAPGAKPYVPLPPLSQEEYLGQFKNALAKKDNWAASNIFGNALKRGVDIPLDPEIVGQLPPSVSARIMGHLFDQLQRDLQKSLQSFGIPPPSTASKYPNHPPTEFYPNKPPGMSPPPLAMGDIVRPNPEKFTKPEPKLGLGYPETTPIPFAPEKSNVYPRDLELPRLAMSDVEKNFWRTATPDQKAQWWKNFHEEGSQEDLYRQVRKDAVKRKLSDALSKKFGPEPPPGAFEDKSPYRPPDTQGKTMYEDLGKLSRDDFWRKYFEDLDPNK